MKKHKWSLLLLSLLIPLFILAGCNSKQNLKGKWNVQDSNHEYTTVTFTDKKVSVNGQATSEDNYLEGTMILAMNRKEKPNYDKYAKDYIREK